MLTSLEAYRQAIRRAGIFPQTTEALAQQYPNFRERSRAAFEQFLLGGPVALGHLKWQPAHDGYPNPQVQAMWCAWTEALAYLPGFALLGEYSADKETDLFLAYVASLGWATSALALASQAYPPEVCDRWRAWSAALRFGRGLTTGSN